VAEELVELVADDGELVMRGVGVRGGLVNSGVAELEEGCSTGNAEVGSKSRADDGRRYPTGGKIHPDDISYVLGE
jgi:hypothetical protein